ncbi:hypothetical protein ACWDSJ_17790 [Nocardia sp. NPDC003482]
MTTDPRLWIIDAANVIGSRPDGWWRDRPAAARRLLTRLAAWTRHLPAGSTILVILEGATKPVAAEDFSPVRTVAAPGSGDDTIVAEATSATEDGIAPITVVTADRGLRTRLTPLGVNIAGPQQLWSQLDQIPDS